MLQFSVPFQHFELCLLYFPSLVSYLIVGIDVILTTSGSVILPAGGPASVAIPALNLVDDASAESDEFFLIRLSVDQDEGEIISGRGVANVTIIDNDRMSFCIHVRVQ